MSRKGKRRDDRQKATSAPAAPAVSKVRRCDDELTRLAETMLPRHRRFVQAIAAGRTGAAAAIDAGFSSTSARSIAYRLMRREDIRRYIRLVQHEQAVAGRVSLEALIDRLWRTVTDENASAHAKSDAMRHLVRIFVVARAVAGGDPEGRGEGDDGLGLTDEKARLVEDRILGVKR